MEPKRVGEIRLEDGELLHIMETTFIDSGGLCFMIVSETGEPYTKLGVYLTKDDMVDGTSELGPNEFFVRKQPWDEKDHARFLATGLFEDTGRRVKYGRDVPGAVWKKR